MTNDLEPAEPLVQTEQQQPDLYEERDKAERRTPEGVLDAAQGNLEHETDQVRGIPSKARNTRSPQ